MISSLQGEANTKEYRQFVQHEGKDVSAWHDIPLQNEDGSFNFVCEIPKETSAKMEVATVSVAVFSVYNNAARLSCDLFAPWAAHSAYIQLGILMIYFDAMGVSDIMMMHGTKVNKQALVKTAADLAVNDLQKEESNPLKQDIKKDKLRFYPYNIHWNYGMLPQTWEDPEHKSEELGGIAVCTLNVHA